MSIQPLEHGSTQGLQVRVFRNKKVITRYLAYKKHGGVEVTWTKARKVELDLIKQAGPMSPARNKGDHAIIPNSNNTSGIPGIRAFLLERKGCRPSLQFSTFWTEGPKNRRKTRRIQRSSEVHGLLGALKDVLDARAKGAGVEMPTPRQAWAIIRRHIQP